MKTDRLLRVSIAAGLCLMWLVGCDTIVVLHNDDSANIHLLGPDETESPDNELASDGTRTILSSEGLTTFTAVRAGQVLATKECDVPASGGPTVSSSALLVRWTGTEITCEIVFSEDPESAGGGTSGRLIPSAFLSPFRKLETSD